MLTVSKMLSVGVFAAFGLVLPRMVSIQLNGLYTLMSTLLFFGSMAATFGVPTILIRKIARAPDQTSQVFSAARRALLLGALLSGAAVMTYLLVEMSIQGGIDQERVVLGCLVVTIILFDAFGGLGEAIFQSREEMALPAILDVFSGVIRAGGGIICLLLLPAHQGVMGVFICFLIGSIMRALVLSKLARRTLPSGSLPPTSNSEAWALVRESMGVALFRLMRMLRNRFDAILIGILIVPAAGMSLAETSDIARGFYGQAMRVVFVFHTFTMALNTAIYPRIARLSSSADSSSTGREFRRVVRYQSWWVAPLAAAVFIWAEQLSGWFGSDYRYGIAGIDGNTAVVLKILAGAALLDCIGGPVGMLLVANKEMDRKLPIFGGIFAATSIGLNIFLIPRYGIVGAAWASVGAAVVEFLLKARYAGKLLGDMRHLREMLPYLGIAGVIGLSCYHFLPARPFVGLGFGAVAYIFLTFVFGLVDPGISERLRRRLKNG